MATKTTTKKKATAIKATKLVSIADEHPSETKSFYLFRFITTVSNLNIGNVIFSDKEVIIYSTTALSQQEAKNKFSAWVKEKMGNDQNSFNMFFKAVFGNSVVMEQVEEGATKRITLPL